MVVGRDLSGVLSEIKCLFVKFQKFRRHALFESLLPEFLGKVCARGEDSHKNNVGSLCSTCLFSECKSVNGNEFHTCRAELIGEIFGIFSRACDYGMGSIC